MSVALAVTSGAVAIGLVLALAIGRRSRSPVRRHRDRAHGRRTRRHPPIPAGFLGLSLEYFAIPAYAGTDPRQLDPVFVQLIRNLAGGSPPELRIGGDTTDRTWWPIPGMRTPAGVNAHADPRLDRGHESARQRDRRAGSRSGSISRPTAPPCVGPRPTNSSPASGPAASRRSSSATNPSCTGRSPGGAPASRDARATTTSPRSAGTSPGSPGRCRRPARRAGTGRRPNGSQTSAGSSPATRRSRWPRSTATPSSSATSSRDRPDYPTIPNLLSPLSSRGLADERRRGGQGLPRPAHTGADRRDEHDRVRRRPGRRRVVRLGPVGARLAVRHGPGRGRRRQHPRASRARRASCSG